MTGWVLQTAGEAPTTFRLPSGNVKTVGRTARADFILDAPLVSRVHCRLTADPSDQLILEDLAAPTARWSTASVSTARCSSPVTS